MTIQAPFLNHDAISMITDHLEFEDKVSLSKTCRYFRETLADEMKKAYESQLVIEFSSNILNNEAFAVLQFGFFDYFKHPKLGLLVARIQEFLVRKISFLPRFITSRNEIYAAQILLCERINKESQQVLLEKGQRALRFSNAVDQLNENPEYLSNLPKLKDVENDALSIEIKNSNEDVFLVFKKDKSPHLAIKDIDDTYKLFSIESLNKYL